MTGFEVMQAFDATLGRRRLALDIVIIGQAALSLLGLDSRPFASCEVLHPALSQSVLSAAEEMARAPPKRRGPLPAHWLQVRPDTLATRLPSPWEARRKPLFGGSALHVWCPGPPDMLCVELFLLCSGEERRELCLLLSPTTDQLAAALPWLLSQSPSPAWAKTVVRTFATLRSDLGMPPA
jgi:hypothetical protein